MVDIKDLVRAAQMEARVRASKAIVRAKRRADPARKKREPNAHAIAIREIMKEASDGGHKITLKTANAAIKARKAAAETK